MTTEVAALAEMRGEMTGINSRMDSLESRVDDGFARTDDGIKRLEGLIIREINDLKQEQLNDHKKQIDRLADDQRRIWDHVHDQDKVAAKQKGGIEALFSAGNLIAVMLGGILTVIAAKLLGVPMHLG